MTPAKETDTKWEMEISHSLQLAGGIVIVFLVVLIAVGLANLGLFHLRFGSEPEHKTTLKPKLRPVEFLYLDGPRVLTYLDEIQGGAVRSEEQSHTLTRTLSAKLQLQDALEAGETGQEQDSIQRAISPTTASAYMELFNDLREGDKIKRIKWYRDGALNGLSEGQFILFHTEAMRSPVYLDPYLAMRQGGTLPALFPPPKSGGNERVVSERLAARRFRRQLGRDPRMVFSLRPRNGAAGVQYLLPLRYGQLNREGSLLKDGGGALSILGKVVRILPEPHDEGGLSYVDFATRQTWRRPLHQAPGALICRSDPLCEKQVRGAQDDRPRLDAAIREARASMESALSEQTQVEKDGAVVIPIAIYK